MPGSAAVTVEVRQIVIRSVVGEAPRADAEPRAALSAQDIERLRAQLLAECRALVAEQLRQRSER